MNISYFWMIFICLEHVHGSIKIVSRLYQKRMNTQIYGYKIEELSKQVSKDKV